MDERTHEFLAYYASERVDDQVAYYRDHAASHGRRAQMLMLLASATMALSSAISWLASLSGTGPSGPWPALAIVLPAVSAAIVSVRQLYQDERNAERYLSTQRNLAAAHASLAPPPELAGDDLREATLHYVSEIEGLLSRENRQWLQLMATVPERLHPGAK